MLGLIVCQSRLSRLSAMMDFPRCLFLRLDVPSSDLFLHVTKKHVPCGLSDLLGSNLHLVWAFGISFFDRQDCTSTTTHSTTTQPVSPSQFQHTIHNYAREIFDIAIKRPPARNLPRTRHARTPFQDLVLTSCCSQDG